MRAAGDRPFGLRIRALIVILWRSGLRIGEALSLAETDLPAAPKKPPGTPWKTAGGATATGQTGEAIATLPGGKQTLRVAAAHRPRCPHG